MAAVPALVPVPAVHAPVPVAGGKDFLNRVQVAMEPGLIISVLIVLSIIPLALLFMYWPKVVNPVITWAYELITFARKKDYLPPRVAIEGYGIRRGLDLVEVAVQAEKPFNEVLGILLVGAMEKAVLRVPSNDPLRCEADELSLDRLGKVERDFVRICVEKNPKKRTERMHNLMVQIIRTSSNKMKGFSLKETLGYYQSVLDAVTERAKSERIQKIATLLVENLNEFSKGITKATNPFTDAPVFAEELEIKRRYRGGGGGGVALRSGYGRGSCACACASCACACAGCACACAGGGR